MFEISDEDDNFWESLPMEDITNVSEPVSAVQKHQADYTHHGAEQPSKRFRPSSDGVGGEQTSQNLNTKVPKHCFSNSKKTSPNSEKTSTVFDFNRNCKVGNGTNNNRVIVQSNDMCPKVSTSRCASNLGSGNDVIPTRSGGSVVMSNAVGNTNSDNLNVTKARTMCRTSLKTVPIPVQGGKKLETPKCAKRKFPGPAGLLPKLFPGQRLNNVVIPGKSPQSHAEPKDDAIILSSQSGDDMFSDTPWCSLLDDLQENKQRVLSNYSVSSCLQKASKKLLPDGKVSLMLAVIETVDIQGPDASVTLKDKTGKVSGTLHRDVVKEFASDLHPGVALVLKQVSVVSPTSRSHYLNITHKNIVHLYGHRASRTTEEISKLRMTLQSAVHMANSQPALQHPHTPTPIRRTSPEFNKIGQGETTPFRPPQMTTPVRNTSYGQSFGGGKSSPDTPSTSVGNRQCQIQNLSLANTPSNSLSETPSKKFNFRPVNKSFTNSQVMGASPVLPRTSTVSKSMVANGPISSVVHRPYSDMSASNSSSTAVTCKLPVSTQGGNNVTRTAHNLVRSSSNSVTLTGGNRTGNQQGAGGSHMASAVTSTDADLWQDDISDELLSQLSEEMM